jgi:translocator protein
VWRERGWTRARGALGLFLLQLALVATLSAFARVRRLAAWLLLPYLAWVGFAAALNYSVWQRNPHLL